MNNNYVRRGLALPVVLAVLAVIAIGGGAYYWSVSRPAVPELETGERIDVVQGDTEGDLGPMGVASDGSAPKDDTMTDRKEGVMMKNDEGTIMTDKSFDAAQDKPSGAATSFSGTVLAGTSAPLLDFTKTDYDRAAASGKLVLLYFYADWCPICRAEFPKMQSAFNELATDRVIGFRVNYKDGSTDANETALAKQFGVTYQHTKVFVKNGALVSKHPDSWDEARYAKEINSRL